MAYTLTAKEASINHRFWSKVLVGYDSGCWVWIGCDNGKHGYGKFWDGTRMVYSHRHAYEDIVGPIPKGKELDHLCRNPVCCNPRHLEPVTHTENVRRGMGNQYKGIVRCKRGHLYDEENTYQTKRGGRRCKACQSAYLKEYNRVYRRNNRRKRDGIQ